MLPAGLQAEDFRNEKLKERLKEFKASASFLLSAPSLSCADCKQQKAASFCVKAGAVHLKIPAVIRTKVRETACGEREGT